MPSTLPQRVACLQPSATVTLADLGLLDRVVACTRWCAAVVPQAAADGRVIVADSWNAQAQEIVAAHPDLLIASVPYQLKALEEILKSGIRFLGLAPHRLQDIYADIAAIAGVMGASERGEKIVSDMQAEIARVRHATSSATNPPRVFCEEWGKPIIHSQRWVAELLEAAGGDFVGLPGSKSSPPAIAALDPDVMVMSWCGAGDRVPLERVIAQRSWSKLRAVREKRVFCIPDEYLNTPATPLLEGLRALAWILHPQKFDRPARVRQISAPALDSREADSREAVS